MELEIAVGIVILLVLVLLATIDVAFSLLSDVGLRRLVTETEDARRVRSAEFLREILENRPRFRLALSSTIQILLITFTLVVMLIVLRFREDRLSLFLFGLGIGVFTTVVFRQVLPRLLVRNNPERKLLLLLPVVRPLYRVTAPFAPAPRHKDVQKLEATVAPDGLDEKDEIAAAEDFHALMEVGEAEGIIEEEERELIESMVELSETRAGEIMTPRTEICAIPAGTIIRRARDLIIEEKYSRIPVYRDNIDNIEGVIYVRDILTAWAQGNEDAPIDTILREPFFVPETKTATELLASMQLNHVQIAIVIDEYGGVAGIVSVEDIIEEIVGEIEDEDIEEEEIVEIIEGEDGYWDVLGSTEVDKIERLFDIDLEDTEATTVAGLVTRQVGYVPKVGERVRFHGLEAEVLRADEKRVHLLRLRRVEPDTEIIVMADE